MKSIQYGILPLLLLFMVSCSKNMTPEEQLLGSWKLRDAIDNTGENVTDKTTFFKGDSMVIEVFTNEKPVNRMKGRYKFDAKTKNLNLFFGNHKVGYKVRKLSDDELDLEFTDTKKVIRNIRF